MICNASGRRPPRAEGKSAEAQSPSALKPSWLARAVPCKGAGMELSTVASFAAAAISLATLVVTTYFASRREHVRWAREELASAFYDFIDASYSGAGAARKFRDALRNSVTGDELQRARTALDEQHSILRHHLTKIRLLAPHESLDLAQAVREAHSNLRHVLTPELGDRQYDELLSVITKARLRLIDGAKKAMHLPR
jgi:hypothetical protein